MFDWQNITVALIILAALVYTSRRAWARLHSMRGGSRARGDGATCATGCGSCGDEPQPTNAQTNASALVQIGRARTTQRRGAR